MQNRESKKASAPPCGIPGPPPRLTSHYEDLIHTSHTAGFDRVLRCIERLKPAERAELCDLCEAVLEGPRASAEETRIGVVKILIALLPYSWNQIERWLTSRREGQAYEIQFTLFCFLDNVPKMSLPEAMTRAILTALADYLHTIDTEAAHAAWMLGDLLGDHWCSPNTFAVLLNGARSARYVVGRSAALSGLEKALSNTRLDVSARKKAIMVLDTVSRTDRSTRIRRDALELLQKVHPGQFREATR